VSAAYNSTCDVRPDLTLNCWGDNGSGQLGNGNTSAQTLPVQVSSAVQFIRVAAGYDHTCGLAADSTAYCWGNGFEGQLGNGTTSNSLTPTPVSSALHFAGIIAGFENTCARTAGGDVWCWGHDHSGDRASPVHLSQLPPLVTISEAYYHVCGLTASGQGYCWGTDGTGQLGDSLAANSWSDASAGDSVVGGLTFISIAAGSTHSCGVSSAGAAYCWGNNQGYQLGRYGTTFHNPTPTAVLGNLTFTSVYAGIDHSCALTSNGTAYCWGTGTYGQLGNGYNNDSPYPSPVAGGLNFSALSLGNQYSCGRTVDGQTYCWGSGGGKLGIGNTNTWFVPQLVH
jgi:alpha-tubulin suppressor-like RCC1 family protein